MKYPGKRLLMACSGLFVLAAAAYGAASWWLHSQSTRAAALLGSPYSRIAEVLGEPVRTFPVKFYADWVIPAVLPTQLVFRFDGEPLAAAKAESGEIWLYLAGDRLALRCPVQAADRSFLTYPGKCRFWRR